VVIVVASATSAVRIAQADPLARTDPLTRDALAAAESSLDDGRRVMVRAAGVGFVGIERTIVNELDRDGADVSIDDDLGLIFGYSRTAGLGDVDEVWYVAEGGEYLSVLSGAPGARVVWDSSPLSEAEEEELRAGHRDLWAALRRAGREDQFGALQSPLVAAALAGVPGVDPAVLDRVAQLNGRVLEEVPCRCAIVAFDPEAAPAATTDLHEMDG
jgi:hypothetical protein